jgi:nucleotide-binding universal stress UspA family protein
MIALREMICATGLTNPARAALRYAFSMAEQFHCGLEVVHVCESPEPHFRDSFASGAERMERAISAHALRERLDLVVRALPTGGAGRATTHLLDGELSEALLAFAERQRAGLVVLGSRPDPDSTRESIAERLMHRTSSGVLTVPSHEPATAPRIKRLLVVLEPGPNNGTMLDWAVLLAGRFGALVQLMYCASLRSDSLSAENRLRHDVEDKLRRAQIGIDASFTEQRSKLAETVLARAARGSSDLIVMGTALRDDTGHNVLCAVRRAATRPVISLRDVPPVRMFMNRAHRSATSAAMSE